MLRKGFAIQKPHCRALNWDFCNQTLQSKIDFNKTQAITSFFWQTPIGFLLDSTASNRHTLRVVAMVTGRQDDEAEKMTVEQMIAMKAGKSFSRYTKVDVELIHI